MSDEEAEEPLEDLVREVESRTADGEGGRSIDDPAEEESREERPEEPSESRTEPSDGPLDDLRREVETRSEAERAASQAESDRDAAGAEGVGDGHFAEMDVDDVDVDAIWADLLFDDGGPTEGAFPAATNDSEDDRPGQVVTKQLCHRCEYFGDPPTLHCTHEGTSIEELVGMDHYRVTNCPMVAADHDEREDDS